VSEANLDLVRSIFADWERGDFSSTDWAAADIVWVRPDGPEPGESSGLQDTGEGWRQWLSPWEGFRVQPEAYRDLDDQQVLVLVTFSGRGMSSGLEVGQATQRGAGIFRIREGKVASLVTYWDRDRALADLGLEA
jgi:ketosteroid isomerase-like protein